MFSVIVVLTTMAAMLEMTECQASCHGDCRLPVTNALDVKKLNQKKWYVTLSNDNVDTRNDACLVVGEARETVDGIELPHVIFNNSGPVDELMIEMTLQPSGRYIWQRQPGEEYSQKDAFAPTNRILTKHDISRLVSDYKTPHVYLTDYKTYMFELVCDIHGMQSVWIYTPTQHPSFDDAINIHNRLLDIGFRWDDIYLKFTACKNIEPYFEK